MKTGIIFIIILIALILAGGYVFNSKSTKNLPNSAVVNTSVSPTEGIPDPLHTINASTIAQKNTFTPSEFRIPLSKTLKLTVTAEDKDYSFKVEKYERLDTTILKGETKTISISNLGVGQYVYSCGTGCSGKIIVEQEDD